MPVSDQYIMYLLFQNEYQEAYELIKDLEPAVPHEYVLKGVVNAAYGQENKLVSQLAHPN